MIEYHDRIEAGRDKPVDLHRLLSVFLDVCQAIAYAHSRGVIHRDLKPENIALDNFGQVIVLDWGLAKLTDDGELTNQLTADAVISDSTMANTVQGDVIGTPLYMAPEQAAGDLDNIDEQTDVYGLGAILFSILTGVAPHADTVSSGDLSTVLEHIANGDTPSVTDHRANVPSELAEICRIAMDRKRHLRYSGVVALSETVERWMAGQAEKAAKYESLRMEGRELRTELQSIVWDLERNTRFMSRLPPIQKLIVVESEKEIAEWRDRLATIFTGLLEANSEYRSVTYCRVDGDQFNELVRVERFGHDSSRIRTVPRTRLRESNANCLMKTIIGGHPDSVVSSLTCDPSCMESACEDTISLLAGVPVFDDETEEVFGTIIVDCDIDQVLRRMVGNRSFKSHEILVGCDTFNIMMHKVDGQIAEDNLGVPIGERAPYFQKAVDKLQSNLEYIDESCSDIYGARLWLIPNKHGIMFVMRQKPSG
ncbi:MAG: serine/threonine-protein kinase [Planctomycetota bacterium]